MYVSDSGGLSTGLCSKLVPSVLPFDVYDAVHEIGLVSDSGYGSCILVVLVFDLLCDNHGAGLKRYPGRWWQEDCM